MFSAATAYERFMGRWSRQVAPELVQFCDVRDGAAVLDVGTGTGVLRRAVGEAVRARRIVGVDPSQQFIDHANWRANRRANPTEAATTIQFQIGDAQQLPFADAEFDTTLSLLVINFIADPARAVREMRRVTKIDGIVGAAVWDYGDGMKMLRAFWDAATALDPANDARDERHMPLCRSGELGRLWEAEGFADVRETALITTLGFSSFDDFWSPFLLGQGPAGAYVAALPQARQHDLEALLRRQLLGDHNDGAFDLPARAWAVRGVVLA